jgi:CBS domain-containing protein
MLHERAGYVLVTAEDGSPLGIVTDRDLRTRVVAEGRDAMATPATAIMSAPLVAVRASAPAFEAMLEMTRREIHHVVASEDGRPVGVLSADELLAPRLHHPAVLARQIAGATSLDAVRPLAAGVTALVRRLLDEGGAPSDIGRVVAELNDRIVARVLDLIGAGLREAGTAAPEVPYCWLAFGSEARREQTLRTDQDNGLVYAEPRPEQREAAESHYSRFADAAIRALVDLGFPPCEGGFMASTPRWCQPLPVWEDQFSRWIREPVADRVLAASIFFDVRPVAGAVELAGRLRDLIRTEAPAHPGFLRLLARDVVDRPVPLTLLGAVAVRRREPGRGTVDLKGGGIIQLVGAARVDALALGSQETNTVDRWREAAARGVYAGAEARDATDAFQHLTRLRLAHQLAQLERGQRPDNAVDPRTLSRADAALLREALRVVARVQAVLRERHATDFATS